MTVPLKELQTEIGRLGMAIQLYLEGRGLGKDKGVGYCLLLFDYAALGHLTYLSNSDRHDMAEVLEQLIRTLKTEHVRKRDEEQ